MRQLDIYNCHKTVRAGKISRIVEKDLNQTDLFFEELENFHITVSTEWVEKHQPEVGGYYVQYKDGYASYSPAEAFEEGYTLKAE